MVQDHQVRRAQHNDYDHSSATDIDVTPLPSDEISLPPGSILLFIPYTTAVVKPHQARSQRESDIALLGSYYS